MKKIVFSFALFCSICGCSPLKSSVLFGLREADDARGNDVVRIYLDKEGFIYPPNCPISDDLLKSNRYTFKQSDTASSSGLRHYYHDDFAAYAKLYKDKSIENADFIKQFNDISIKNILKKIKSKSDSGKYSSITFLMVGFNNTYQNPLDASNTSHYKLRAEREKISNILEKEQQTLFVELHWDGTFRSRRDIQTSINFKQGLESSLKVGLQLRPLINQILHDDSLSNKKIYLFSHSSAANIICEVLFDQKTKINRLKKAALYDELNSTQNNNLNYQTPDCSDITAVLVAPAISGIFTFKDYYQRSHTTDIYTDRYQFYVCYNTNDPVLRKNFGRGLLGKIIYSLNTKDQLINQNSFSSTSLGCLESEVKRVENLFRRDYNINNIKFVDFSFSDANKVREANAFHEIDKYLNTPQYESTVKMVYGLK